MVTTQAFDATYLEHRVDDLALVAGIKPMSWGRFREMLQDLKSHNEFMYTHSLRVGLYSYGLALHEGADNVRFSLFAGCGHDIGKCEVGNHLLDAKALGPEEFEQIKRHTHEGFAKLKGSFLFTAFVAGLHHKYRPDGYGIDLDTAAPFVLAPKVKAAIEATAKLVMMADFFDALTTRTDNKGFIQDPSDPVQLREVMTRFFPGSPERTTWLIANRVS